MSAVRGSTAIPSLFSVYSAHSVLRTPSSRSMLTPLEATLTKIPRAPPTIAPSTSLLSLLRFSARKRLPHAPRKAPIKEIPSNSSDHQQHEPREPLLQHQLADPKHRAINQGTTHDPIKSVHTQIAHRPDLGSERRDALPPMHGGMNAPVKLQQPFVRLWRREQRGDNPHNRRRKSRNQRGLGEDHGVVAGKMNIPQ